MRSEIKVNAALAEKLGLSKAEFARIKKLIGRIPNFTELGVFSAMWSEHCSYKSSRKLFKLFPTKSERVVVGAGEENSGAVDIGGGLGVVFKMESHNHPSAVEPFIASATGLGGCLRDIFTMGARPVAAMASLRLGRLENKKVKWLFSEITRGLADYANKAKVSVVGGETYFDESYEGNPLVNAFVAGIVDTKKLIKGSASVVGNAVYYLGRDTGRDGVGGASFASKEIHDESAAETSAVAIGDPELGRRLREACLELIDKRLLVGMQDMGAAGLTSSSSEIASRSGRGIEFDVALVPRCEKGMTPYEVLLSESQERMLAIISPSNERKAQRVLKKWNVNAVKIGRVMRERLLRVKENGVVVCEVPPDALTKKAPLYTMKAEEPRWLKQVQTLNTKKLRQPSDLGKVLLGLLSSPSVASKAVAYKKFKHKDSSVLVGPGSDAAVVSVKGARKALAISVDCNGRFCFLNPYQGAMMAVAEAARNVVCAGGKPLAVTDGLNFGNPQKPENYWQFAKCVEGLSDACRILDTPVVSGNVSFYNENPSGAIDPTPMIGLVGLIADGRKRVTQEFKRDGSLIANLGEGRTGLGGSEYLRLFHKMKRGNPQIDMKAEKRLQSATLECIEAGLLESAHDCSEGGLAVALAECCISNQARMLGARISLDELEGDLRLDDLLFGEAPSRIVVSFAARGLAAVQKIMKKHAVPFSLLGEVGGKKLVVDFSGKTVMSLAASDLSRAWRNAIPKLLR